jgi:hypothetical protein
MARWTEKELQEALNKNDSLQLEYSSKSRAAKKALSGRGAKSERKAPAAKQVNAPRPYPKEAYEVALNLEAQMREGKIVFWMYQPQVCYHVAMIQPDFLVVSLHQPDNQPAVWLSYLPQTLQSPAQKMIEVNPSIGYKAWVHFQTVYGQAVEKVPIFEEMRYTPPAKMTAPERRFANDLTYGCDEWSQNVILWIREPSVRMPGQTYSPDFMVVKYDSLNMYEVKGAYSLGSESRSSAKLRWANAMYPQFNWYFSRYDDKGGEWKHRLVKDTIPNDTRLEASKKAYGFSKRKK